MRRRRRFGRPGPVGRCRLVAVLRIRQADLAHRPATASRSCARQALRLMRPSQASNRSGSRSAWRWHQAETNVSCVASAASAVIAEDGERSPVHGIDPAAHEGIEGGAIARLGLFSTSARSIRLPRGRLVLLPAFASICIDAPRQPQVAFAAESSADRRLSHTWAMPDHIVPLEQIPRSPPRPRRAASTARPFCRRRRRRACSRREASGSPTDASTPRRSISRRPARSRSAARSTRWPLCRPRSVPPA